MKCKVKDCENHTDQGVFVGFLCMPCYTFLNTGEGTYSQLYRNTVAEEREACAGSGYLALSLEGSGSGSV